MVVQFLIQFLNKFLLILLYVNQSHEKLKL